MYLKIRMMFIPFFFVSNKKPKYNYMVVSTNMKIVHIILNHIFGFFAIVVKSFSTQ